MLFPILTILCVALYFMTTEERHRLARTLRVPVPQSVVTPTLVGLHTLAFLALLLSPGAMSDSGTLIALGGNVAPRTTNGEWGRLVTSVFLHAGLLAFIVNMLALISVGPVLERLVGPLTFLAVYFGAGVLGGLVSLSTSMTSVTVGPSAAIFGLYGLLVALWAHGAAQRATTTVRLETAKRLAPLAGLFVVFSLADGRIAAAADCTGIVTGFVGGLVLGRWVPAGRPPARKVALTLATAAAITLIAAVPLRGVADVMPALDQLVEVEARIAKEYDAAVERFTKGRITPKALASVIEEHVSPELERAAPALAALRKIPPEHRPLVAAAETYLRLRQESWRIRAVALRTGNSTLLRTAEHTERASLEALALVRRGA
jgi:rhomboid protease GluP